MPQAVYLSGPMTGLPDYNYPAFNAAAERWRKSGWDVLNPAENFGGSQTEKRSAYLRADVEMLLKADGIALLDGWEQSKGAKLELLLAQELGLRVFRADSMGKFDPGELSVLAFPPLGGSAPRPALVDLGNGAVTYVGQTALPQTEQERAAALTQGVKYDAGKPRLSLIPERPLRELAELYGFGAGKYTDFNWRKGMKWRRVYDALQRHALAWLGGEDVDPESGAPHMAAVAWNAFSLMEYRHSHPELDDRFCTVGVDG